MRGLLMAVFAFEFPGFARESDGARVASTKTKAKTTTKTV